MISKINLHITPQPGNFPPHGGVREHLQQLYNAAQSHPQLTLVNGLKAADIIHVESSYTNPSRCDVYVCHGGFVPQPISSVIVNLARAKVIVSVSRWIVDAYFPQYAHKTVVIPNGVDLTDIARVAPAKDIEPGFFLYAKEWPYYMDDFIALAGMHPEHRFVTTVWPGGTTAPSRNIQVIGNQSHTGIISVLKQSAGLILTGPEVCPTMLFEAWACSKPVLAKNVGGSPEFMNVEDNHVLGGWLYDDLTQAGSVLDWMKGDGGWVGQQARKRLEDGSAPYLWKRDIIEQYVNVYEAIVNNDLASLQTLQRQQESRH